MVDDETGGSVDRSVPCSFAAATVKTFCSLLGLATEMPFVSYHIDDIVRYCSVFASNEPFTARLPPWSRCAGPQLLGLLHVDLLDVWREHLFVLNMKFEVNANSLQDCFPSLES